MFQIQASFVADRVSDGADGQRHVHQVGHLPCGFDDDRAVQLLGQLSAACLSGVPTGNGRELRCECRRPHDRHVRGARHDAARADDAGSGHSHAARVRVRGRRDDCLRDWIDRGSVVAGAYVPGGGGAIVSTVFSASGRLIGHDGSSTRHFATVRPQPHVHRALAPTARGSLIGRYLGILTRIITCASAAPYQLARVRNTSTLALLFKPASTRVAASVGAFIRRPTCF